MDRSRLVGACSRDRVASRYVGLIAFNESSVLLAHSQRFIRWRPLPSAGPYALGHRRCSITVISNAASQSRWGRGQEQGRKRQMASGLGDQSQGGFRGQSDKIVPRPDLELHPLVRQNGLLRYAGGGAGNKVCLSPLLCEQRLGAGFLIHWGCWWGLVNKQHANLVT